MDGEFARKTAMLGCALCVLPVLYAPFCKSLWVVVALVGLGTAAHQGWSANLYTIVSDMFPRSAVGSVVGIGGTLGAAWRRADANRSRLRCATHAQLRAVIHLLRPGIRDCAGDRAVAGAEAGGGGIGVIRTAL